MAKSIFGYLEEFGGNRRLRLDGDLARHEEWTEAILPADTTGATPEGETSRRPLVLFSMVVGVALLVLTGRLFMLQVFDGQHNLALAEGNRIRERVARAPRGIIYDRNKAVLVRNQASYDVTVVSQLLARDAAERKREYEQLAALTGAAAADIAAKAEADCKPPRTDRPACLNSPVPVLAIGGLQREQALLLEQHSGELPGFALDVNPIREYTDGNLLSAFLGYTGRVSAEDLNTNPNYGPTSLIGKLGLERQYESQLRGADGGEQTEVDALGRPVRVLASRDPVPGQDLVLSIDLGLQQVLAGAVQKQMEAAGSKRAAGVAMDPRTGEVLAAVSLPSYDNNLFSRGISNTDFQVLLKNPGQPLFNKVVSGGYPSGSIIKPFGAAAALQERIVDAHTTIVDSGSITIPNKYDPSKPSVFHGWERDNGLGAVNVLTAIARSSDIFFYEVMGGFITGGPADFTRYLGVTKLTEYYKKFGLGSRTGIDLPSEARGRVPTPEWKKQFSGEGWYTGDTYNISVGQGDMLVSPLQMVTAVSALANGGRLFKPHLVKQIVDGNGKVTQEVKPEIVRDGFISPDNLALVRRGMWMAVNDPLGTACCRIREEVPVPVGAKTGTAETVVHDDGSDAALQGRPHAWFEAFAPFDNPRIAIVVLVEHAGEGAQYAAPAARETLAWYFTQGAGAINR